MLENPFILTGLPVPERIRGQFGRAAAALGRSIILGYDRDNWLITRPIQPAKQVIDSSRRFVAMLREWKDGPLDHHEARVEELIRLLETELCGAGGTLSPAQVFDFGAALLDYTEPLLARPSDEHARLLVNRAHAARMRGDLTAYTRYTQLLRQFTDHQDDPWRAVYGSRLHLLEGESFRLGFPEAADKNYPRAACSYHEALACADQLANEDTLAVPGITFAARYNLWQVAMETRDWPAARAAWRELWARCAAQCREDLPFERVFAQHVETFVKEAGLEPDQRGQLRGVLQAGLETGLLAEERQAIYQGLLQRL